MKTDPSEWHNTGGNGKASAVWCRTSGRWSAEIQVMPYRCLVTMYFDREADADHEGIPLKNLAEARRWVDAFMAREATKGR